MSQSLKPQKRDSLDIQDPVTETIHRHLSVSRARAEQLLDYFESDMLRSQLSVHATNPLVNKGEAVRYLAEDLLGLSAKNIMAIGDNFNDIEMLYYAGFGIAMGNAPLEVQAIAQWVAPSVEQDGVATAIEAFIL